MESRRMAEHYERRVLPGRPSHEILDWHAPEEQTLRFDVFASLLASAGLEPAARDGSLRLLDVGCGLADLRHHLRRLGYHVRYVGVDLAPGVLGEARRRMPAAVLAVADACGALPFEDRAFEVVYSSGVFNLEIGCNLEMAARAMAEMARVAARVACATFLHARTPRKHPECHYFDPAEVAAMFPPGFSVAVVDDYLPKDFTVVASRTSAPPPRTRRDSGGEWPDVCQRVRSEPAGTLGDSQLPSAPAFLSLPP